MDISVETAVFGLMGQANILEREELFGASNKLAGLGVLLRAWLDKDFYAYTDKEDMTWVEFWNAIKADTSVNDLVMAQEDALGDVFQDAGTNLFDDRMELFASEFDALMAVLPTVVTRKQADTVRELSKIINLYPQFG